MNHLTRVEEIYLHAVREIASSDREAYLSSGCGNNAALRREVEKLLAAHDKVGKFLEQPLDQTRSFVQPEPIRVVIPSTVIAGRYKLLERIGEGGQRLGGDVDGTGLTVLTVMTLLTFLEVN